MSLEQSVTAGRVNRERLQIEVYEKNTANIRQLSKNLPEDVVINLAHEVIRRVALRDRRLGPVARYPSTEAQETLCHALLSDDDTAAAKIIMDLRTDGANAEEIYLTHLAGAARMLGTWWEVNKVSFAQVTTGSGRMLAIMRGMRHLFEPVIPVQEKTAIFASVPGEDHTMGVRMAADIFRKEGWDISLKVGLDHEALVAEIEQEPTSIVGLSIGGRHSIDELSRLVFALHISCPQALLLVSGQDIKMAKPLLSLMGLDGIAADISEAKDQMAALWERKIARAEQAAM